MTFNWSYIRKHLANLVTYYIIPYEHRMQLKLAISIVQVEKFKYEYV